MNQRSISDMHRCNKTAITAYSVITFALIAAYLIEVIKGSRTVGYFIVFCLFALLPYVVSFFMYKRDNEAEYVKYILAIGFSIFSMFIIFTTTSPVAYTYALLIAVVLLCYNDIKLSSGYMISVCFSNVAYVVWLGIRGQLTSEELPSIEIRVISLILFAIFIYMATKVLNQNNAAKMQQIEEEKEHTDALMQQIMEVSERLTEDIQVVTEKMEILGVSSDKTKNSMEEVARGTSEAVDTIQVQLEKTEEIQRTVQSVTNASENITEHVEDTNMELEAAQQNIDNLIRHVQLSNEANENMSKELEDLYKYTNQMQSIVQMINEVTDQTSLLSLNASIEAARAGEAGRGFAVVASEISSLATQTQQATVDITNLIENISRELESVVRVINQMVSNAEAQNIVASNTADSFSKIAIKNHQVAKEAGEMSRLVVDLEEANELIIKGIETISAVTEEVTAHSSETLESTEENNMITTEVGSIVEGLNRLANELRVEE